MNRTIGNIRLLCVTRRTLAIHSTEWIHPFPCHRLLERLESALPVTTRKQQHGDIAECLQRPGHESQALGHSRCLCVVGRSVVLFVCSSKGSDLCRPCEFKHTQTAAANFRRVSAAFSFRESLEQGRLARYKSVAPPFGRFEPTGHSDLRL